MGARGHGATPRPQGMEQISPPAPHVLCHDADFDPEDTGLLFGRGPLQAHISACELHGELHLDLWETGVSTCSLTLAHHLHCHMKQPWRRSCNRSEGLTPFISITSMCQFFVCTACGSSCGERWCVSTVGTQPHASPAATPEPSNHRQCGMWDMLFPGNLLSMAGGWRGEGLGSLRLCPDTRWTQPPLPCFTLSPLRHF